MRSGWAILALALDLGAAACGDDGSGAGDVGANDGGSLDAGVAADAALELVSVAEAVAACVVLGSCDGQGPNECIDDFMPRLTAEEIRCLAAAGGDCGRAFACVGVNQPASCQPGCEGDVAVQCPEAIACPTSLVSTGPTCVEDGDGLAVCGGPGACAELERACAGSFALTCQPDGFFAGADCARYGWSCDDPDGFARCSDGTSAPCDGDNYPRCDGGRLIQCLDGREIALDCGRTVGGMSCHLFEGDADGYCGLGSECDPLVDDASCDGDLLTACVGGATHAVDCVELGFSRCLAGRCS